MFSLVLILCYCVSYNACFGYNSLIDQEQRIDDICDFKFEIAQGANVTVVLEDARFTTIVFELKLDPRCSFKDGEEVQLSLKTVGYTATKDVDFKCI